MVDYSGEAWANIFASEAEMLLGATAEKMAEHKSSEDEAGESGLESPSMQMFRGMP